MAITVKKLKFLASKEKEDVSAILIRPRDIHGRPWVQEFEADTRVRLIPCDRTRQGGIRLDCQAVLIEKDGSASIVL